jgi:phosphoglycolate phosphatase
MRQLILFDVDGTLISTGGKAGRALVRAIEETFSAQAVIEGYRYSGKTDPQIVHELLATCGIDRERATPVFPALCDRYLGYLEEALAPGTVHVLPGVHETLEALRSRDDVLLGLLTGNLERGAAIKLRAAGLSDYFQLGAYGSDAEDRNRLVPVARARAYALTGDPFAGGRTVVIGDAEADVRCAKAGGARSIAVASGWTTREQLGALEPDVLLDSLADPAALAALLDGSTNA